MASHCNILHLEDDDDDSLFFERALAMLNFTGIYCRTSTVKETIEYLSGLGKFQDRLLYPLPDVIVMDNSPKGPGLMLWLDQNETLSSLKRVMLTGGLSESDTAKWLSRGVDRILLKGSSLSDMAASAQEVLRMSV